MIEPSCKDCKERYVGCHSHCEKYLEFRKQLDEYNQKEKEEKKLYGDVIAYNIKPSRRRR